MANTYGIYYYLYLNNALVDDSFKWRYNHNEVDPIADLINDTFDLYVKLGAYPDRPTWTPIVEWKTSLLGNRQSGSFTSWEETIPISTAIRSVSSRTFQDTTLKLTFIIKVGQTA